ncbi:MAG: NAD(P)H-dependent oxidoreductase [Rhizobiales bacterium]|nr:NAD(P)H-dependent oxidoreductase [Hyphomicrobiales bacterium]
MPLKLNVIIASTRPGRIGPSVADWFHGYAREHGAFEPELVDLAAFNLPLYDEPKHPRLQQYEHEHTKAWSRSVASADAFAFVTPEYNFFAPPALVNAIDFVLNEWSRKPAGIVSYGGVSGGLRSASSLKLLLTGVNVMPVKDAVSIPMVSSLIDENKVFRPNDLIRASAQSTLDELAVWAAALKATRG